MVHAVDLGCCFIRYADDKGCVYAKGAFSGSGIARVFRGYEGMKIKLVGGNQLFIEGKL